MAEREKRTKVIDCIETILKYLNENEKELGETYYMDVDGDTFETDMGYFYEGLENLKDYLNEKNQRETEMAKYRKYFEGWLYEILNNNFENKEFCKPRLDMVKIPADATNGDVIRTMFPNAKISLKLHMPSVDIFFGGILMMRASMEWWNAKYKAESEAAEL